MDLCWLGSYYEEKREVAERIAEQFFAAAPKAFLDQEKEAWEAVKVDVFLREYHTEANWAESVAKAKEELGILGSKC